MILHVPEGQWADALTALTAGLDDYVAGVDNEDATFKTFHSSILSDRLRPHVEKALRAALLEIGLGVTVTTDEPGPEVVS
jgi:hypothetical protein